MPQPAEDSGDAETYEVHSSQLIDWRAKSRRGDLGEGAPGCLAAFSIAGCGSTICGMLKDNFVRIIVWVVVIGMVVSTIGVGALALFSG